MLTLLQLLDIFVVFMVCIRLVKSLFGPCLVISFSLFFSSFFSTPIIIIIIIIIISEDISACARVTLHSEFLDPTPGNALRHRDILSVTF